MKKLFQITELKTGKAIPDLFFEDKQAAKAKRRELNGLDEAQREKLFYVVSYGPDHNHHARR